MEKVRRLTLEEEKDIMSDVTHERNMQQMIGMLPYFFLDERSYNIANEALQTDFESINGWDQLSKKLHLNDQHRAFYKISVGADEDESYTKYINYLMDWYDTNGPIFDKKIQNLCNIIRDADLNTYDTYLEGRFTHNKQEQKLFKWLLRNNIFLKSEIEDVTTARNNKSQQLMLVSRNPIDYIFISTNQNYSSCMDLDSYSDGCFWLSYPATFIEKDRFLVAVLPDVRLKTRTFKNEFEFKHFKYKTRSWFLWLRESTSCDTRRGNNRFHYVRWYPTDAYDCVNSMKKIYNVPVKEAYYDCSSKHSDNITLHWADGEKAMCYIDSIGIKFNNKNSTHRYARNGRTCDFGEFDYAKNFDDLGLETDINILKCNGRERCIECNDVIEYEEDISWVDHDPYCSYCYDDYVTQCDSCGEILRIDSENYVSDYCICSDCYDKQFAPCEECGDMVHEENAYHLHKKDKWVCYNCYIHDEENEERI